MDDSDNSSLDRAAFAAEVSAFVDQIRGMLQPRDLVWVDRMVKHDEMGEALLYVAEGLVRAGSPVPAEHLDRLAELISGLDTEPMLPPELPSLRGV